jgi:hypothetical protein
MSEQDFLDGVALSQILPAPLIIFATFVGYFGGGPLGALAMTLGIFLPAFLFSLLFFHHLESVIRNPTLHHFLEGVAAAVVGLIAIAVTWRGAGATWQAVQLGWLWQAAQVGWLRRASGPWLARKLISACDGGAMKLARCTSDRLSAARDWIATTSGPLTWQLRQKSWAWQVAQLAATVDPPSGARTDARVPCPPRLNPSVA